LDKYVKHSIHLAVGVSVVCWTTIKTFSKFYCWNSNAGDLQLLGG